LDKKIKTLLLNLPQNVYDVTDYSSLLQPYGLALIASVLKQRGYDVVLFDAFAYRTKRENIINYIYEMKPMVLGIPVMTPDFPQTVPFLKDVKKLLPETVTVIGGIHPTIEYQTILQNHKEIDIAVIGEGEYTVIELIEKIQNGQPLDEVKGIAYRQDGNIKVNMFREFIQDLSSLPFADWESLPMEKYWDRWTIKKNYACMLLSRGCPYNCTFCGHGIIGKKYRKRSPVHITEEIKLLYDKYHVRNLTFADSTLNVSNDWLVEICENILKLERHIIWGCSVRADRVNKETLKLMKKSGCVKIFVGVESADNEMLKRMKKNESIEKINEGFNMIKEAGLTPDLGFIIGMPGETKDSIMKTIRFARRFYKTVCSFTYATPYPGTEFYETAKKEGFVVNDWSKFNTFMLAYVPKGLTEEDIRYYFKLAVKGTYLRISFLITQLFNVKSWLNFKVNTKFAYRLFFKIISKSYE
jgi:radical SAM superfamily enzyme YgiQ (UPF0313 family)